MGDFLDARWLEYGVTSALLITVIVYILRVHIPALISTFDQGFSRVTAALKEINTQIMYMQKRVDQVENHIIDKAELEWRGHDKECRAMAKDAIAVTTDAVEETRSLKEEFRDLKYQVHQVLESISKIL